jgi:hypothetical protein
MFVQFVLNTTSQTGKYVPNESLKILSNVAVQMRIDAIFFESQERKRK